MILRVVETMGCFLSLDGMKVRVCEEVNIMTMLFKITENSLAWRNFYCNMIKIINCSTSKMKTYFKMISLIFKFF